MWTLLRILFGYNPTEVKMPSACHYDIKNRAYERFNKYFSLLTDSELVVNVGLQQEEGCHPDMGQTNQIKKALAKDMCAVAIAAEQAVCEDITWYNMLKEELIIINKI